MEPISIITLVLGVLGVLLHIRKVKSKCFNHPCLDCDMKTDESRPERQQSMT